MSRIEEKKWYQNPLLVTCLVISLLFTIVGLGFPDWVFERTNIMTKFIVSKGGAFYLYLGFFLVVFCIVLALSPYGKLRLGKDHERPEYSTWSWIAMLYSAGMGVGLLQRAVQEPVYYYRNPPITDAVSQGSEVFALQYAFFHWGFTAWAFYAAFGIIAAFFQFRKNYPARPSSSIRPFTTNPIVYTIVDVLAVLATLFGLIASVGFGCGQISGSIAFFNGDPAINPVYTIIIALIIGVAAFISAWTGLEKGIRIISQINISGAIIILIFFLFSADTQGIIVNLALGFFYYLKDFVSMSLALGDYGANEAFVADWTIFYWAFWLAWAPFTGLFIARISRGRTLRSFVLGTLFIPSIGTFLWFSTFGTAGFDLIQEVPITDPNTFSDIFTASYEFFEYFSFSNFWNLFTVLLSATFLITSLDSAIVVLGMITSAGIPTPSKPYKIIWGVLLPLLAASAIWVGGDTLLRSMSNLLISTALPFGIILLIMIAAFLKALLVKDKSST